jgi:glycogen(starch) synthase
MHSGSDAGTIWYADIVQDVVNRDLSSILMAAQRIQRILREFEPDVIHYHPSGPELLAFSLVRPKLRVPVVTSVHVDLTSAEPHQSKTFFDTLSGSAATVAISNATAEAIARRHADSQKINLIPNAVWRDHEPFSAPTGRRLLALGRIVPEKGFDLVIKAMPHILAEIPDVELTISGNGPARSALEDGVRALGLSNHVRFPGWIAPELVRQAMREATVVIVPSRWNEPFGLVALEAAWTGRPVIALSRGGLSEIVRHGETGILIPDEDPAAIGREAVRLLRDSGLMARLGKAAREHAERAFDFERFVDRHVALYESVVSSQHGTSVAFESR